MLSQPLLKLLLNLRELSKLLLPAADLWDKVTKKRNHFLAVPRQLYTIESIGDLVTE